MRAERMEAIPRGGNWRWITCEGGPLHGLRLRTTLPIDCHPEASTGMAHLTDHGLVQVLYRPTERPEVWRLTEYFGPGWSRSGRPVGTVLAGPDDFPAGCVQADAAADRPASAA